MLKLDVDDKIPWLPTPTASTSVNSLFPGDTVPKVLEVFGGWISRGCGVTYFHLAFSLEFNARGGDVEEMALHEQ